MTRLTPEQIAEIKAFTASMFKGDTPEGHDWNYERFNDAFRMWLMVHALLSHIEADGWQTMETAPRDGTPILGAYYNDIDWEYRLIAWNENLHPYPWQQLDQANEWSGDRVSYWRPLPAPPETKE